MRRKQRHYHLAIVAKRGGRERINNKECKSRGASADKFR